MHTSLLSNLVSVTSTLKLVPFVGVRSRRPVEHVREMRLFLDLSDIGYHSIRFKWERGTLSS